IDSLQNKVSPPSNSLAGREFSELGRLVTAFFEYREALWESNEVLEQRVVERTAALQTSLVSLQETQQRFQEVVDRTPVTIFVIGPDAKLLLLEGHGVRTTRLPREKFLGRSVYRLCGGNRYLHQRVRNVLEQGDDESFTVMIRGAAFDVRMRPLKTPEGELDGAIGIALDVTERQRFEAVLRHQALYDTLTGLPNRTHFREELERALREARADNSTTAILFLDLDNFKLINDTLGHEAGDGLLRALASRLQDVVEGKGLVARLAGDEFVILLERVANRESVEALGGQLSAALSAPISLAGRELYANGSIGIALSASGNGTSTEMLRHADVAMYRAKQSGRGRWCTFDESMSQNLQERLELESDLRNAAIRNELKLVYQPILSLKTGEVEEVEALLRWNHPRLGLIAPYRFIHIAESLEPLLG
ncbi:MAG: diguanylate cyclase, partial [Armatimonas sp.]